MQFKAFAVLAIIVLAQQQVQAATISFGGLMSDVSKVAVAGEKVIHQIENQLAAAQPQTGYVEPATQNLLSDMANGLGDLANTITSLLSVQADYVKPEPSNLLGDALGDMGTALGDLANTITSLSVAVKAEPEARSLTSSGASIIGEMGSISAKTIAAAANAAAPYIKQLNAALGDLANTITSLKVEADYVKPQPTNLIGDALGDMGSALGDLANTITSLSMEIKAEPETRSLSSAGASTIGETGSISAKTIAGAADAAAPYVKQLNSALGDLANTITGL